jgi:hypothetical protein
MTAVSRRKNYDVDDAPYPTVDRSEDVTQSAQTDTSSSAQAGPGETIFDDSREPDSIDQEHTTSTLPQDGEIVREDVIAVPERFNPQEVPPTTPQTTKITVLKEWEGVVDHVCENWFRARLSDIQAPSEAQQLVEIDMEDVAPDDRHLLEEGAIFYWDIGRKQSRYGSVANFSEIRFRRMPAWSKRDLAQARKDAKTLREELFGDAPQE